MSRGCPVAHLAGYGLEYYVRQYRRVNTFVRSIAPSCVQPEKIERVRFCRTHRTKNNYTSMLGPNSGRLHANTNSDRWTDGPTFNCQSNSSKL